MKCVPESIRLRPASELYGGLLSSTDLSTFQQNSMQRHYLLFAKRMHLVDR